MRFRTIFFLTPLLFLAAGIPSSFAADPGPEISVKAEVDRAFITIGDHVTYTVTIRAQEGIQVVSTIPVPNPDLFRIKKIDEFRKDEKGFQVQGKKFVLTAYQLGEHILDPVEIRYLGKGGEAGTVSTQKIYLTIKSVAEGVEKTDIRDIKGVLALGKKGLFWGLLGVLLALSLGGLALWLKRRGPRVLEPARPPMTAEEEAFFELNRLFESDLLPRGKFRDYYLKLSEILRHYFGRRYGIQAIESTTDEVMRDLRPKDLPLELAQKIREVLEAADLAKFAKWKPEGSRVQTINRESKEIVEACAPKEAPKAEEAGDGV
ncbi:MAG: hypothetical protein ACOY3K_00915 [Candidatus Omnitrophota bacterium]